MTRWAGPPGARYLVPPECCPACGWGFGEHFPTRPAESFMTCSCPGADRGGHTLWTCDACGALVAEGCLDVRRWGSSTTPAGLPDEMRWAAVEE